MTCCSLLAALALAAAAPSSAAAPALADNPEAAFERYRDKINLHDFDALAADVIAADAQFTFGGERHRGIAEVRTAFNRTWSTLPDEIYSMTGAEWISRDTRSAVVTFQYRYRGTMPDGTALEGGGLGINLYRRRGARWWLVHEHLSSDPSLTRQARPASP